MKSLPGVISIVTCVSISFVLDAQNKCFGYQNCFSPPLPPVFRTQLAVPESRSGNNYNTPFDTIVFNPTLGTNGFDVVICLDGVINSSQIALADNYVDSLVSRLQTVAHYSERFKYFNIYRIAKYSSEAGSAWGFTGDTSVDNRYGSRFNAFGLDRLLIPEKIDTLFSDVAELVPEYDLVLMLTYDKKYGGSGWTLYDGRKVASFSIDEETGWHLGDEVIIHEMQHIMPFAGHGYLGDEYEDSLSCIIYDTIPESPNFTSDTTGDRKWEHCMNLPGVGFYSEAGICPGNYRPTASCVMSQVFNMPPFCPVCRENSTAYFDSLINPVYYASISPAQFTGSYVYKVQVDTLSPNLFRYEWFLDDSLVAAGVDSLNINFDLLSNSQNHILKFVCTDTDPHIIDTLLRRPWVTEWNLLTKDTTVSVSEISEDAVWSLFPNPASDYLFVTVGSNTKNGSLDIIASDGKVLLRDFPVREKTFSIPVSALAPGVYWAAIKNETGKTVKPFYRCQDW